MGSRSPFPEGYTPAHHKEWQDILAHELLHFYTPTLVGFRTREMWYSEGFTVFYATTIQRRLGWISDAHFQGVVQSWCRSYRDHSGRAGFREAGRKEAKVRPMIYEGGALFALALDLQIRRHSSNRKSLDEAMRSLYKACGSGRAEPV